MKFLFVFMLLAAPSLSFAEVGIDLHDTMTMQSTNPIEIWRKMRPQDFIGAPTVWQVTV